MKIQIENLLQLHIKKTSKSNHIQNINVLKNAFETKDIKGMISELHNLGFVIESLITNVFASIEDKNYFVRIARIVLSFYNVYLNVDERIVLIKTILRLHLSDSKIKEAIEKEEAKYLLLKNTPTFGHLTNENSAAAFNIVKMFPVKKMYFEISKETENKIVSLMQADQHINAIKLFRRKTCCPLDVAKKYTVILFARHIIGIKEN